MLKNIKIQIPLLGSLANVCTELSIPDLTKKVPVTLNVKVSKQRITVQKYSKFLFSKTNNECNKAVWNTQEISTQIFIELAKDFSE